MPRRSPRTAYPREEASMARPLAAGDLSRAERSRGPAACLIPFRQDSPTDWTRGVGVWTSGAEIRSPASALMPVVSGPTQRRHGTFGGLWSGRPIWELAAGPVGSSRRHRRSWDDRGTALRVERGGVIVRRRLRASLNGPVSGPCTAGPTGRPSSACGVASVTGASGARRRGPAGRCRQCARRRAAARRPRGSPCGVAAVNPTGVPAECARRDGVPVRRAALAAAGTS